jgi:hypothetical protein
MNRRSTYLWQTLAYPRGVGLSNELVHHLLIPYFFVWFMKWNGLMYHHIIPHKLIIRISVTNGVTLYQFFGNNILMMHHLIYNGLIRRTKHNVRDLAISSVCDV